MNDVILADDETPNAITCIEVKRLFGRFTYRLELPAAPSPDLGRMMILYGDNGSGKTTILRCLFHLISAGRRGHRTYLAGVPFEDFSVSFSNGLNISARRSRATRGPYRIELATGGSRIFALDLHVTPDNRVPADENPALPALEEHLSQHLPQDIYYVGDDRRLLSDSLEQHIPARRRAQTADARMREAILHQRGDVETVQQADLQNTIDRAIEWLRRQAIRAANLGNQSSNYIYADVLRRISTPTLLDDASTPSLDETTQRLEILSRRNNDYRRFGLVPTFDSQLMLDGASQVAPERRDAFLSVLIPFLDGLEARLDALASLYDAIDAYVDAVNSFFVGKQLSVVLPRDIIIQTTEGDELQPEWLSSGERQLLLILTNTLFAHERPGVFIIDEPELSLNMKWQRKLVDALLSTTRGTETQFVLATHSFEVMTSARDRILHLAPEQGSLPLDPGSPGANTTNDDG